MLDRTQRTIMQYDSIAKQYAQNIQDLAPINSIEKFLSLLPHQPRILDLGCAAGRDCKIFKERGATVTGVDLSDELLNIARNDHPEITFVKADVRSLPFEDNSFDGIWSLGLLHHLEKKEMSRVLSEWHRVLTENGTICIQTKYGSGELKTKDVLSPDKERIFTLLDEDEFSELMNTAGFIKSSLSVKKDPIRQNLSWIVAFYKKIGAIIE